MVMKNSNVFFILKVSVLLIFIGRAWQHIFWDAPYRTFFWDESLLKPIIERIFNTTWKDYVTSSTTDNFIQNIIKGNGILYAVSAIACISVKNQIKRRQKVLIFLGGISLVILAFLMTKEKFYHGAQFFEHSIQFGLPFVMIYFYHPNIDIERIVLVLKVLIAFTFFSHGLYAFGVYPIPGNFVDMIIQTLGFSEKSAITFLYIAGFLDFVIAVLIFIPKFRCMLCGMQLFGDC